MRGPEVHTQAGSTPQSAHPRHTIFDDFWGLFDPPVFEIYAQSLLNLYGVLDPVVCDFMSWRYSSPWEVQ